MYKFLVLGVFFLCCQQVSKAQQLILPHQLNYFINPKPNTLLYNDTLYRGAREFKGLFYKTGNLQLIHYYQKHQQNKIWGNVLGILGAGMMGAGVGLASNHHSGLGWTFIGGGFCTTVVGGYLIASGQKNLILAVDLFNKLSHQQLPKVQAGIGFSGSSAGLVINF